MKAVITGDIINSRRASTTTWMPALKSALNDFGKSPATWEIFRGDSFQLLLEKPQNSLLAAMRIKARLKKQKGRDARMAIGLGTVTYRADAITESNGDAFVHSGATFEQIRKTNINLAIRSPWPDFDEEMNLYIQLALIAMNRWSEASAEFMEEQLSNSARNQEELARSLGISQASVSERKARAHFDELLNLEQRFRTRLQELV